MQENLQAHSSEGKTSDSADKICTRLFTEPLAIKRSHAKSKKATLFLRPCKALPTVRCQAKREAFSFDLPEDETPRVHWLFVASRNEMYRLWRFPPHFLFEFVGHVRHGAIDHQTMRQVGVILTTVVIASFLGHLHC